MGFLSKLFKRGSDDADQGEEVVININVDVRRQQLLRLEKALDALAQEMRTHHTTDDPGWRGRVNEYSRLAGDAMTERRGTPTRESLLDLVFQIRPVFTGEMPEGYESLSHLQDEVMHAANDLRVLIPGEKV